VLRPCIHVDPFDLTFEQKCVRNAKRACIALAVVAFSICALDLMNVPLVKAAGDYLRENQQRRMSQFLTSSSVAIAATQNAPLDAGNSALIQRVSFNSGTLPALEITTASISPGIASVVRLPTPGERLHLTGTSLAKAERCLASAVYFEARAEPARGQSAVAQVVMNRVFSGHYPGDICDVVYQSAHQHCQFSFACSTKRKAINERGAWARANRIAARTLAGDLYDPALGSSTHFHATYIHPDWVHEMRKIVRYGTHSFYRPIAWGSGAHDAIWAMPAIAQGLR
jgi:Cell Wall Hydrolase